MVLEYFTITTIESEICSKWHLQISLFLATQLFSRIGTRSDKCTESTSQSRFLVSLVGASWPPKHNSVSQIVSEIEWSELLSTNVFFETLVLEQCKRLRVPSGKVRPGPLAPPAQRTASGGGSCGRANRSSSQN